MMYGIFDVQCSILKSRSKHTVAKNRAGSVSYVNKDCSFDKKNGKSMLHSLDSQPKPKCASTTVIDNLLLTIKRLTQKEKS